MWQCEIITKSSATIMTMWGRLVTLVWISEQTIETESNNIKFTKCFAILLAENICKKFTEAWLWWSFLQQILASTCYWLLEYQLIIDWGSCWKFKILIFFDFVVTVKRRLLALIVHFNFLLENCVFGSNRLSPVKEQIKFWTRPIAVKCWDQHLGSGVGTEDRDWRLG